MLTYHVYTNYTFTKSWLCLPIDLICLWLAINLTSSSQIRPSSVTLLSTVAHHPSWLVHSFAWTFTTQYSDAKWSQQGPHPYPFCRSRGNGKCNFRDGVFPLVSTIQTPVS